MWVEDCHTSVVNVSINHRQVSESMWSRRQTALVPVVRSVRGHWSLANDLGHLPCLPACLTACPLHCALLPTFGGITAAALLWCRQVDLTSENARSYREQRHASTKQIDRVVERGKHLLSRDQITWTAARVIDFRIALQVFVEIASLIKRSDLR